MAETDRRPRRVLYGRRQGRPLRPGRRELLARLLPALRIEATPGLDPSTLFQPPAAAVWLELGFGGGEHLAVAAKDHPGIGFLGAEPFLNGIASLLARIERERLGNIRIFPEDGRILIEALAEASIARCFILFPDPWPKLRHHKRRLVNPKTAGELARIMSDGARLLLASDDADYVAAMRETMTGHGLWQGVRQVPEDTVLRPPGWIPTRYEAKALAKGLSPHYLLFERMPRGIKPLMDAGKSL
ncbi:MAG: tRNA (guanosine(46)-N7)-methyltransferase TrmB [Proteobacteria bacterium]|nr:tRNA (guanosine(46)-N7)-methyltransferase TrmB [Pseudomonadota bacterium]MBI3499033.1 tRNA (guanosine(46)-N7)-methyltransferase TrmB [Pseudomonadota bacterium]